MAEKTKIVDFELVEDLQDFISFSPDVEFKNSALESQIKKFPIGTLLKIEKEIGSPITIMSVEEVTDKLVEDEIIG